jgi:hypothetical protein
VNLGYNPTSAYEMPGTVNQGGPIQVIAPNTTTKPFGLTSDDYRNRAAQYIDLTKIVANNQNPNGLLLQVGPSMLGDPNIGASDGFQYGMMRALEPPPGVERLHTLDSVDPSGAGRRQVPNTALAASSKTSPYVISDDGGITTPPDLTRWSRQVTDIPYTAAPGGGQFYVAAPDSIYIKGNLPTVKDQTLVPQMSYLNMASAAKGPQAGVNPVGTEMYQTGDPAVNTTYTRWMSNRGQGIQDMTPGLSATYTPSIGVLTTVVDDKVGIHQGNPQYAGNQYVNTPTMSKSSINKGTYNPRQPNNSIRQAAYNNPFVVNPQ